MGHPVLWPTVALVEDFDGVGTGEEEPVVVFELGECGIEEGVGVWRDDFDGGDEDGGRAEGFELSGEVGGLVAGSGYEDAFVFEGHLVVIVVGKMWYRSDSRYSTMYESAQFYPSRGLNDVVPTVFESRMHQPGKAAFIAGLPSLKSPRK